MKKRDKQKQLKLQKITSKRALYEKARKKRNILKKSNTPNLKSASSDIAL